MTPMIASASFGPMLLTLSRARNAARSSEVEKPNNVIASSRTCVWMRRTTGCPGSAPDRPAAPTGKKTSYPTPLTSTKTEPSASRCSIVPLSLPITGASVAGY